MLDTPVLTVKEARPQLPQLIKRTVLYGEEIHMGAWQKDEATLIASASLARYKALAQLAQRLMEIVPREFVQQALGDAADPAAEEPWVGLKYAMRTGRVGAMSPQAAPVFRRSLPTNPTHREQVLTHDTGAEVSVLTLADMAARGNRGNRTDQRDEFQRPFRRAGATPTAR